MMVLMTRQGQHQASMGREQQPPLPIRCDRWWCWWSAAPCRSSDSELQRETSRCHHLLLPLLVLILMLVLVNLRHNCRCECSRLPHII